ncbi:hypothetical protein CPB84DRAFT_1800518 [Gymnopilus junonius]|uniref:Uncharacterized protein n=1 Tax=Gymnopilus junonius TaxID=109634 RepID=A0A9P5NAD0_GYMJU|nr:hypothetical protein CPB84DRAFT_1800518 [Gymnopilus junonius]
MPLDNIDINFNSPQLIVNSANAVFDLSLSDSTSVNSRSFNGNAHQQWIVLGDATGNIAVFSKYNKKYIAPQSQVMGSKLVVVDAPYWWKIDRDGNGYILTLTNSIFGLSMEGANLCLASEATRLFFIAITDANINTLKFGKLPKYDQKRTGGRNFNITVNNLAGTEEANDVLKELQNFLNTDGIKILSLDIGSSQKSGDTDDKPTKPTDPDGKPAKEGASIFGTSKPKRVVYSQTSLVPPNSKGKADIIGFGADGVAIWRQGSQTGELVTPNFGFNDDAGRWRSNKHVRLLADTTGNGRADVVGFSDSGVSVAVNKGGYVFEQPKFVLSEFGYDDGWRVEKHLRFVADLRNAGRGDIIGFSDEGVFVSLNNRDGTFSPSTLAIADFGYSVRLGDWKLNTSLRFLADVNGNGLLDIVGFNRGVAVSLSNGDGTFQPANSVLADFTNGEGWYNDKHPRFLADLTGDGLPDIIGMKDDGVYIAFNKGNGTFNAARKVIDNEFCYKKGWRIEKHPIFIADLTGDGSGDLIGFYDDGVYAAVNNGDKTFKPVKRVIDKFSGNENWKVEKHPRYAVDITGDGRADIVGIGDTDVYVSYNDGKGNFGPQTQLVQNFGDGRPGWAADKAVKYLANLYP